MSADRLAEIKARCDAATEGPWARDMHSPDMSGRSGWYIRGPRKLGLRSMVLNSRMLPGDAEFVEAAREDVPWLVDQVERLTAERDAFRKREEHLVNEVERWRERFPCDGLCSDAPEEDCSRHGRSPADLWRIISEIAAERDALVTTVGRVQALVDSNPDHADTCGSVLTPGAGYPCSCWQADLRAALATTGEDQ